MEEPIIKIKDNSEVNPTNKVEEYSKYLPGALKAIEDRLPISSFIIVIVGYVIIAAFGEMDNVWKYLGYLSIFVISFVFYKLMKAKLAMTTYLLLGIIVVLLIYIAEFRGFFDFILGLIK